MEGLAGDRARRKGCDGRQCEEKDEKVKVNDNVEMLTSHDAKDVYFFDVLYAWGTGNVKRGVPGSSNS